MKAVTSWTIALSLLGIGCGGAAAPTQQLADAQAATRTAEELGAEVEPQAQLHLKMARQHLAQAKAAMKDDENEKAESLLKRAKADAELSVALMHDARAQLEAERALDDVEAVRATQQAKQPGESSKESLTPQPMTPLTPPSTLDQQSPLDQAPSEPMTDDDATDPMIEEHEGESHD